ncbi:MAG: MgtE intracellular N domain protein [Candidatus Methanoperedenaceae archaeon GB37]|nr:MAG: MgtE intracellular N domain protein [Candidatus Methanoperedenaceae archaeon GB37]
MPRFSREHSLEYTQLKKNLRKWLRKRDYKSILKFLTKLHPADISELIDNLPEDEEKAQLFSLLDLETASDVMADLSEGSRRAILKDITHDHLTDIVKDLPSDEAADILGVLPKERVERILAAIPPQDSAEVKVSP